MMDAAKILEMDYNTAGGGGASIAIGAREASLVQTAFRMPTPTHQDKAKIMAGAELIKAVKQSKKRSTAVGKQSHSQVAGPTGGGGAKSIQSAQPLNQKKHSLAVATGFGQNGAAVDNWNL